MTQLSMGSRLYISTRLPVDDTKVEFYESLPLVQIKGIRDGGEITEQHETLTRNPISLDFSYQEAVGEVLPSLTWEVIYLESDRGQRLLYDAFRLPAQAFCIKRPDRSQRFFIAKVRLRTDIIVDQSTLKGYRYELDLQCRVLDKSKR